MALTLFTKIALIGWPVVVLVLYAALPPRRAAIVGLIGGWLFLPVVGYKIPGFPDFTKIVATNCSVALGMLIFDSRRVRQFRPRLFDLPMLIWCTAPFVTSMSNDLGPYDGFSAMLDQVILFGLPYLIGRLYFNSVEGLRELLTGVAIGGVLYLPLCLWEIRMAPDLHKLLYGVHPRPFRTVHRYGGYRPMVFMSASLMVGLWMAAASVCAFWLWITGHLRRLLGVRMGWVVVLLVGTTIACKVAGAILLMAYGIALYPVMRAWPSRVFILGVVFMVVAYVFGRVFGGLTPEMIMPGVESVFDSSRSESLQFRLENEQVLTEKAMERPWWGWGRFGRSRVLDANGKDLTVTDSLWIIALGRGGLVGLGSLLLLLVIPTLTLVRRIPASRWTDPAQAVLALAGVLCVMWLVDNMVNAMVNVVYVALAGGLCGIGTLDRRRWVTIVAVPLGGEEQSPPAILDPAAVGGP